MFAKSTLSYTKSTCVSRKINIHKKVTNVCQIELIHLLYGGNGQFQSNYYILNHNDILGSEAMCDFHEPRDREDSQYDKYTFESPKRENNIKSYNLFIYILQSFIFKFNITKKQTNKNKNKTKAKNKQTNKQNKHSPQIGHF